MENQIEKQSSQVEVDQTTTSHTESNLDRQGISSEVVDADGMDLAERVEVNALLALDEPMQDSIRDSYEIGSNIGEDAVVDGGAADDGSSFGASQDRTRGQEAVIQAIRAILDQESGGSVDSNFGDRSIRDSYQIGSNIGEDAVVDGGAADDGSSFGASQDRTRGQEAVIQAIRAILDQESGGSVDSNFGDRSIRDSYQIGSNIGEDAVVDGGAADDGSSFGASQDRTRGQEAVIQAIRAILDQESGGSVDSNFGDRSIRDSYQIGSNIGEDAAVDGGAADDGSSFGASQDRTRGQEAVIQAIRAILDQESGGSLGSSYGGQSIRDSYQIGSNIGEDATAVLAAARSAMGERSGMATQSMERQNEAAPHSTKAAMDFDAGIVGKRSGIATQSMERQNEAAWNATKAAMGFDAGTGVSNNDSVRATQDSTRVSEAVLEAAAAAVLNAKKDEFE